MSPLLTASDVIYSGTNKVCRWTESQLKSFLDRHGIPNPNPRTRDALLSTARDNYQTVADKLGENAAYPGNWLYETWSESDLKFVNPVST